MLSLASFLSALFLSLLMLVQPAVAQPVMAQVAIVQQATTQSATEENPLPVFSHVRIPYPSFEPKFIILLNITLVPTENKFISSGPLFTEDGFRFRWVCPDGAYSADNTCYEKQPSAYDHSKDVIKLVLPTGVQIASSYDIDEDVKTNGQILFTSTINDNTIITKCKEKNCDDLSSDSDGLPASICRNPARCLAYMCPNGKFVSPPSICAR